MFIFLSRLDQCSVFCYHFLLKILNTCNFDCRIFSGTIKTKARIDYESIKQIYVNAFVTDTGVPQLTSTAEIIVDIINTNDNDPVFTSPEYRFKIAENSPKGAYVGNIDAKDNDDGKFILFSESKLVHFMTKSLRGTDFFVFD